MSFSTNGNLEGRTVYAQVVSGRLLGEGPFTDLSLRCGGPGDDTRKISLQVSDGTNYVEEMAVSRLGLNIANVTIRNGISFGLDRNSNGLFDQNEFIGRLQSRKSGSLTELSFSLDTTRKTIVFDSERGAQFNTPSYFKDVLRATDVRVHGAGATFTSAGLDAALVAPSPSDGAMAFVGLHKGARADFEEARFGSIRVDRRVRAAGGIELGDWIVSAASTDLTFETTRDAAFILRDSSADPMLRLSRGDLVVRGDISATDIRARSGAFAGRLKANSIDIQNATALLVSTRVLQSNEIFASSLETESLRTKQLDASVAFVKDARTTKLRSDSADIEVLSAHSVDIQSNLSALAARFDSLMCNSIGSRAPSQSPLKLLGRVDIDTAYAVAISTRSLDILDESCALQIARGEIRVNGILALKINASDGSIQSRTARVGRLDIETKITAPVVRTYSLESIDTGNLAVIAEGLTLGNLYLDSKGSVELLDLPENDGTMQIIARNGLIIRTGASSLGSFEPPMLQVIRGQGVRQSGSLYLITPFTGKFIKFEPPAVDDEVLRIYVNATGQAETVMEIEPDQTRIPHKLLIGPAEANVAIAILPPLQVRSELPYGGPVAEFAVTNSGADAELLLTTRGNVSLLALETSSGQISFEHRSLIHKLAFHNAYTGNDFLIVDTIDGLTQVPGDLHVGGSLYFGGGGAGNGNGVLRFNQDVNIGTGNLGLGANILLLATGNTGSTLTTNADRFIAPVIFSPSFALSAPPDGSPARVIGFNTYLDKLGADRLVSNGTAALLQHNVLTSAQQGLASLRLSFSPPAGAADAIVEQRFAAEITAGGNLALQCASDAGRLDILQNSAISSVQFETTRASYSFDKSVGVLGDLMPMQTATNYHVLRSTDDGLQLLSGGVGVQAGLVIGDPSGKQWRMRMDVNGHLVFEYQVTPGAGWVSGTRVVPSVV